MGFLLFGGLVSLSLVLLNVFVLKSDDRQSLGSQSATEVNEISNYVHFEEGNQSIGKGDPFALLLLGIDGTEFKNTRSDSIILAIVDPDEDKISMLSIYRDLLVNIPNRSGYDKINASYNYGGADLVAATIEDLLGISINHYAVLNFDGFRDLVDAIGGLTIDVEKNMGHKDSYSKSQFSLNKGVQKLDGIQTLNYVRFRNDAEGDFGRTRRQRQVISELSDQTISFRSVTKIQNIYKAIDNNLDTNISVSDIVKMIIKMRDISSNDINTIEFEAHTTSINGISYVEAESSEIERLKGVLKDLLE